jgi:hypothetical protein
MRGGRWRWTPTALLQVQAILQNGQSPFVRDRNRSDHDLRGERLRTGLLEPSTGDTQFFFQLLLLVKAGVITVQCEQVLVPADLYNSAMVQYCDLVCIAHG